jgi:hypothetical protein
LIADAILDSARGLGATIAIANAGGIRNTIPAGVITDKRARGVLPFANSVSVLHITGHTLGQALNNSVSALGAASGSGRFLQIAGARMKFDMGRNQTGRAFDVHTLNTNGTWSPLQSDTVYVVAVPDFIRNGGDDFDMLAEKNLQAWDQGPGLASVLIAYLEARYPTPGVRPLLEGRIVNATAGAPPLVYACASSMVLSALEGNLRDGCAAERVYTRIRWAIEPPEGEEYLAIVLTIRIDPQWLEGHNGTGTLADTEFINIISGQVSPAGDGFTYSSRCAPPTQPSIFILLTHLVRQASGSFVCVMMCTPSVSRCCFSRHSIPYADSVDVLIPPCCSSSCLHCRLSLYHLNGASCSL